MSAAGSHGPSPDPATILKGELVLASASAARRRLLEAAGVRVRVAPVRVDEAALRRRLWDKGVDGAEAAVELAEAKARAAAQRPERRWILAADQILEHRGQWLGKPDDLGAVRAQLQRLRGDVHRLHTAAVLWHGDVPRWRHVETALLQMRCFSDRFLESYLRACGEQVRGAVGGYHIEGLGVHLFERVEGCLFAVQGLPLLPALEALRRFGILAA